MTAPAASKGRAAADRERRDVVTGEVRDEAALVRFVASPDGVVTPDVARKLPGRGIWVAADRASVETAARKNLFSRSAKAKLSAPADLADQVQRGLEQRILAGLGLARRAGVLTLGFEKVAAALAAGQAAWLIEASDGAPDGRRKMLSHLRKAPTPIGLFGVFDAEQLGLALGSENVIHAALLAGRVSTGWTEDVRRLAGFRPIFPEGWREGLEEGRGGSLPPRTVLE